MHINVVLTTHPQTSCSPNTTLKMVTALRFGKPVPHTSSSAKGKEGKDQGGGSGKSREERERDTAAATATAAATTTASNKNDKCQKAAHNQRRQNLNSSSATNRVQSQSASASSTQLNTLPLAKNNTYAATQTQSVQKIRNGESGPLMTTNSASWRPMMHDKAIGSINSNGGNFRVSAPLPSAPAPIHTKAIAAKHKMSEEEEWIKTFNDVREYKYQHGYLPASGWNKGKSAEEVDLIKWMQLQRYLYQNYLEGGKSALSHTRIDLLRSIGMIDNDKTVSNVESKRMCMFWGCNRALGEFESFHCAEHRNVNTATLVVGDPSRYNTSKRAVKRRKTKPKVPSSKSSTKPAANDTKHSLKSPPEEMLKNGSNPKETTNTKEDEDDVLNIVKLAAGAVAKEMRYLGLQPSSSTDHVESAIERFAVEVYCPLLYSSKERSVGTSSYSADRILLSTLLALQEMLVTNAEKFFPLAGLKGSSVATDHDEAANSKLSRDFARALVQNAAKRLQRTPHIIPNQDHLIDRYLEASRRYESRGEDFQLALGRLDASATYRNAKGSTLSGRESIIARTSFNFARENHPLVRENDMLGGQPGAHPAPNACAIFVMEEGKSVQKEDTLETSAHNIEARHEKRTKVRESRIRLLKRYFGGPT